jgi:RND superfamily putative drug exporter
MPAAIDALARFVARRRGLVLGVWVLLLIAALPLAMRQTEHLTGGGFDSEGSGTRVVAEALDEFTGAQGETLVVVIDNRGGDSQAVTAALDRVRREGFDDVEGVAIDPAQMLAASGSRDPIVVMPLEVTGDRDQVLDAAAQIRRNLRIDSEPGRIHLAGQSALWAGVQQVSKEDLEAAELIGLPIVLGILLVVFGSLAAAALPLALGFAAVMVTGAAIFALSLVTDMSVFVTNIASMLGIGVAVDYSLFILARYREELAGGRDHGAALVAAMRTSGLAVVFSGVTVVVSLAGLFLVGATVVDSMAIGAIVVVAIAVIAAITLLPALIALLGRRVARRNRLLSRRGARGDGRFWDRWTGALMRRPLPYALAAGALMLGLALPALSMQLGSGAVEQLPEGFEARVGAELAAQAAGPGAAGPVHVLADFGDRRADTAALERFVQRVAPDAEATRALTSHDARMALVTLTPVSASESAASEALVQRLRAAELPGARVSVGGPTAQNIDISALVSGSLWKVLLFVCVLSLVVLLLALRSIVLPVKAVLMNLLSVAAAYGVLVMVFQWGWLDGVFGYDSLGYIQALTPALLLAIVFGLSMDYEVFMLSRIKERYQATGDNRKAVAQGLAASAGTISSAALIMVAVFAIFAFTGVPQIKEIGVGLAVAIFLDATVIRLVLVPTTLELLGERNWWLPESLDRVLPEVDFEAERPALAAR